MNGEDVGQLNLYIKVGPGIPISPSRILQGSWGPFWIKDKITFNLNAQLDFEVYQIDFYLIEYIFKFY